jgi:hypothetical protein
MNDISKVRFDALASYARDPVAPMVSTELRWLEFGDERVVAALLLDTDGEFSAVILARDLKERFRWVDMTAFFSSPDEALRALEQRVEELLPALDQEREQGDESGPPVDFFTPVRTTERLHPSFVRLATKEGYSPARHIIEQMMRWYDDVDGNFVEQFQTTGFDARIWELYLFAALSEAGFRIDSSSRTPDFAARGLAGDFSVEATTANPPRDGAGRVVPPPPTDTPEQELLYFREYLPIRYAGPLTAKLVKRYWEQPHVRGVPLVFAIQDFHERGSMTWSRSGLSTYLYGYIHEPRREANGSLSIVPHRVATHRWGTKEVPSAFFMLPGAENVSAVIFNSSATISKFNRIGLTAGFGSGRVRLVRQGLAIDHTPSASEPKPFVHVVDENYTESWTEGMDVYHNPAAKHALDPALLPSAAHHHLLSDGVIEGVAPEFQPLTSLTSISIDGSAQA